MKNIFLYIILLIFSAIGLHAEAKSYQLNFATDKTSPAEQTITFVPGGVISFTDSGLVYTDATTNSTIDFALTGYIFFTGITMVGDIDGNGSVDISDLGLLVNIITGISEPYSTADIDGDGKITTLDLGKLINLMLNL